MIGSREYATASPFASTKLFHERQSPNVKNVDARRLPTAIQRTVLSTVNALAYGTSHGRKKGWRAIDLGVSKSGSLNERFQSLLCQDTKELVGFLTEQASAGVSRLDTQQQTCNGQFGKSKRKCNSCTISYLAKAWGVSQNFPLNNMNKVNEHVVTAAAVQTQNPTQQSIIDSFKESQVHCSAKKISLLIVLTSRQMRRNLLQMTLRLEQHSSS